MTAAPSYLLRPNPDDSRLTRSVSGIDQDGNRIDRGRDRGDPPDAVSQ